MSNRYKFAEASPETIKAMFHLNNQVKQSSLEPKLVELIKARASQINGCGFCVDTHTKEARKLGENEQRLYLLSVWRAVDCFTEREKAALAWTELITLISEHDGVSDEEFAAARSQFSEKELVDLTVVIIAINGFNRLNVAFATPTECSKS